LASHDRSTTVHVNPVPLLLGPVRTGAQPRQPVTLARERDALGLRRVQLDWQLTDLDKRTVEVMTRSLGEEVVRLDLGRVRLADWLLDGTPAWPTDMHGGSHPSVPRAWLPTREMVLSTPTAGCTASGTSK
jgi:hypothetical protein